MHIFQSCHKLSEVMHVLTCNTSASLDLNRGSGASFLSSPISVWKWILTQVRQQLSCTVLLTIAKPFDSSEPAVLCTAVLQQCSVIYLLHMTATCKDIVSVCLSYQQVCTCVIGYHGWVEWTCFTSMHAQLLSAIAKPCLLRCRECCCAVCLIMKDISHRYLLTATLRDNMQITSAASNRIRGRNCVTLMSLQKLTLHLWQGFVVVTHSINLYAYFKMHIAVAAW